MICLQLVTSVLVDLYARAIRLSEVRNISYVYTAIICCNMMAVTDKMKQHIIVDVVNRCGWWYIVCANDALCTLPNHG